MYRRKRNTSIHGQTSEKKTWTTKRLFTLLGIIALIVLMGGSYYFTNGNSKLNVDKERIAISEIEEGTFQEFIPINGTVLPISSIFLDASVGGRVEEKYVEDGLSLVKGDPIMGLSNTDLELTLVNQETQVLNLLTQTQIAQTNAQQASIANRNQMADVEQTFKEAERAYRLNTKLYEERAVGSQEFQKSENEFHYQKERIGLISQILHRDSISSAQKVHQDRETYERTQRALGLMRRKVGELIARAPVDGQLAVLIFPLKKEILESSDKLTDFLSNRADIRFFAYCENPLSNEKAWGGTFQFDDMAEWKTWTARYAVGDSSYIHTFGRQLLAGNNFNDDPHNPEF